MRQTNIMLPNTAVQTILQEDQIISNSNDEPPNFQQTPNKFSLVTTGQHLLNARYCIRQSRHHHWHRRL
jgi:hypothetical protein